MKDSLHDALARLEGVTSLGLQVQRQLDADLDLLFGAPHPERFIPVLLGLLERFAEEDEDVLWSILHGLEGLAGYEPLLRESVQRQPSVFGVRMVGRILNDTQDRVLREPWMDLLRHMASHPRATARVRAEAADFLTYQEESGRP